MRLIDADALQKTLFNDRRVTLFDGTRLGTNAFLIKHETVYNLIEEAPTIDAEPVRHGEWENYPSHVYRRCSLCKVEWEKPRFNVRVNYCPHCGAKMDGGKQDG